MSGALVLAGPVVRFAVALGPRRVEVLPWMARPATWMASRPMAEWHMAQMEEPKDKCSGWQPQPQALWFRHRKQVFHRAPVAHSEHRGAAWPRSPHYCHCFCDVCQRIGQGIPDVLHAVGRARKDQQAHWPERDFCHQTPGTRRHRRPRIQVKWL